VMLSFKKKLREEVKEKDFFGGSNSAGKVPSESATEEAIGIDKHTTVWGARGG